ncbi:MAG: hypothetical protein KDB88_03410 [Flavobacteriales bacterium]|nr:hypothetical protein [Flavobacteriales bacterium]
MRYMLLLVLLSSVIRISLAQCGPYKFHPLWPDTLGWAYLLSTDCDSDSAVWDNGSIGYGAFDLEPGSHYVIQYDGGTLLDTTFFELEQLHWNLEQLTFAIFSGLELDHYASIPYCGTSIFNYPTCTPPADSVVLFLMQDGIPIDSITPLDCMFNLEVWMGLPYGHIYQCIVEDRSQCGSTGQTPLVTAYACNGMSFVLEITNATSGQADGSVAVLEMMSDTVLPLALPPPFTGTFSLHSLPNYDLIGSMQGSSAVWTGLAPGDYLVQFTPDSLCFVPEQQVAVGTSTSLFDPSSASKEGLRTWTDRQGDLLFWNENVHEVRIMDINGRLLRSWNGPPPMDVSDLAPNLYILDAGTGGRVRFVRY